MQRVSIEWLCDSPSPYNSDLFRAIAEESAISLNVSYHQTNISSHPWKSGLTEGYQSRTSQHFLGLDWDLFRLLLSPLELDQNRLFVIGSWNHSTAIILLTMLSLGFGKYVIWSDTPNLKRHRGFLFSSLRSTWLRWILRRAYRVMGTGKPAVEALEIMGAQDSKLVIFPYWIDLDLYNNLEIHGFDPEINRPLRLISIGRIVNSLKGHDLVLNALAEIKLTRENLLCEYYIIGAGEDAEAIEQQASQLGLDGQVKVLGWLEPKDIRNELEQADVLIHPSPVHEPYGVAILEGMAAGKVILASDVTCAALDRIEEKINGFIHPAGDVKILAAHIIFFLDCPAAVSKMGQEARKTAQKWPINTGVNIIRSISMGEDS
jgi:glycosyltransferase involved in cell wall biosynthesis